jgi:hypothetical protein
LVPTFSLFKKPIHDAPSASRNFAGDGSGNKCPVGMARACGHGRYVAFQMAEIDIPRNLFADMLRMLAELRSPPVTSTA